MWVNEPFLYTNKRKRIFPLSSIIFKKIMKKKLKFLHHTYAWKFNHNHIKPFFVQIKCYSKYHAIILCCENPYCSIKLHALLQPFFKFEIKLKRKKKSRFKNLQYLCLFSNDWEVLRYTGPAMLHGKFAYTLLYCCLPIKHIWLTILKTIIFTCVAAHQGKVKIMWIFKCIG